MPTSNDLITIEVKNKSIGTLERVDLLNAALFRVLRGVRLIEILESNYRAGWIRLLAESSPSHPPVEGTVCVTYERADARILGGLDSEVRVHNASNLSKEV